MKTNEIEINGETIKFRFRSIDVIDIEKKEKKPLLQYVQEESVTMCINLLRYARRFELPQFSEDNACELYDKLINDGWTYKRIIQDIIYETLVASGFLTKEEWEKAKKETEEIRKMMEEKMKNTLQSA